MMPYLNLLSPADQKEVTRVRVLLLTHEIILFIFIFISIGSAGLLLARTLLEQKFQQTLLEKIPGSKEVAILNRDIRIINKQTLLIDRAIKLYHPWSPILVELATLTPPSVQIETMQIQNGATMLMRGHANTREELLTFKDRLEKSPYTVRLVIPLQSLAQDQDITFTVERTLNIEALTAL